VRLDGGVVDAVLGRGVRVETGPEREEGVRVEAVD